MSQFDKFVEDVMSDKCEGMTFNTKMDDIGKYSLGMMTPPEAGIATEKPEDATDEPAVESEEFTPCEHLEKLLAMFDISDEDKAEILEKLKDKAIEMAEHEAGETEAEEAKEEETVEAEEEKKEEKK